ADDQIALTEWLADDLAAKTNDLVTLKYYMLDSARRLTEQSRSFRVAAILPPSPPPPSPPPPSNPAPPAAPPPPPPPPPGLTPPSCPTSPASPKQKKPKTGTLASISTSKKSATKTSNTGINSAAHRKPSSPSRLANKCGATNSET